MGRGPRAGRCLDSSHRDIAVTKRRSRSFHICPLPKGHYILSPLISVCVKQFAMSLIIGNYNTSYGVYRC